MSSHAPTTTPHTNTRMKGKNARPAKPAIAVVRVSHRSHDGSAIDVRKMMTNASPKSIDAEPKTITDPPVSESI